MAQCLRPQRISELENPAHSLDQIWAVGRACPSFAPAHPGLSGRPGTRVVGFRNLASRGRTRDVSGLGEGLVGLHDFPEDPCWTGAPEMNQNPRRTWNWWGSPLAGAPSRAEWSSLRPRWDSETLWIVCSCHQVGEALFPAGGSTRCPRALMRQASSVLHWGLRARALIPRRSWLT